MENVFCCFGRELFVALLVTIDNKIANALQKWLAGEQLAALVQLQNDKNSRERHEQLAGDPLAARHSQTK